jgi:hypothetical protein
MSAFPNFIGGSFSAQSPVAANEALINWFVEPIDTPGGTSKAMLNPTPGVDAFCTLATSGGRAAFATDGRVFVIVGTALVELFEDETSTTHGTVATDGNPAYICTNGDGGGQLGIVSGGSVYCFDLGTNTLTTELTGGYTHIGMLYGYFVAFRNSGGTVQIEISDLFDGTTWDPTQFAGRTIGADSWQAMLVDPYGYILLLGSKTAENWYNSGAYPFPFAPDPSGLVEEGIAAPHSLQQAGKSKVWLSTNANGGYQVMRATGFTPQRISTHALEQALAGYTDIADAIGATREDRGHAFYYLTFPQSGITWVYNFGTNQWHQQGTWLSEDNRYTYWRPVHHCFGFSKHLAVDRESNIVYQVSDAFATDVEDRPIRRLRRTPAVTNQQQIVYFDNLELLMETGIGLVTGDAQDTNPVVMLRWSDDFGRTWGPELQMSAGTVGAYQTIVKAWGLGSGRGRVYEVSVSAAVPWRIIDAFQKVRASREVA